MNGFTLYDYTTPNSQLVKDLKLEKHIEGGETVGKLLAVEVDADKRGRLLRGNAERRRSGF